MQTNVRAQKIARRDLAMVARYYYWTELERLRFDDTLTILSNDEFFVAERTILNTINKQDAFLNSLIQRKAQGTELRKMFPSYNWEVSRRAEANYDVLGRFLPAS